jgi:hypothetical protein
MAFHSYNSKLNGMKKVFFTILCLFITTLVFSQTKKYEVTAEGNALMCPFMGPRLTKQLESFGAINLTKSPTHVWNFEIAEAAAIDSSKILEIVQKVGYNPTTFRVKIEGNE